MNITEFAKHMGVSKTTIYRRIGDAGIDLSTLRDADGKLTNEGLATLSSLLDGTSQGRTVSHSVYAQNVPESGVNLVGKVEDLERQLSETRSALDEANACIAALHQQAAERERENADAWRRYLERQQQIEAQRLLTAQAGPDGRGFFGRIRDRLFGTKQPADPVQPPTNGDQD
jgi:AcrR family transcriptional regulator